MNEEIKDYEVKLANDSQSCLSGKSNNKDAVRFESVVEERDKAKKQKDDQKKKEEVKEKVEQEYENLNESKEKVTKGGCCIVF